MTGIRSTLLVAAAPSVRLSTRGSSHISFDWVAREMKCTPPVYPSGLRRAVQTPPAVVSSSFGVLSVASP
eukprot:s3436_g2.t1